MQLHAHGWLLMAPASAAAARLQEWLTQQTAGQRHTAWRAVTVAGRTAAAAAAGSEEKDDDDDDDGSAPSTTSSLTGAVVDVVVGTEAQIVRARQEKSKAVKQRKRKADPFDPEVAALVARAVRECVGSF